MLGTYADAQQIAGAAGPWFGLALVLLGIAAKVARGARRSARLQGERVGELERRADSELTRRRQVESTLLDLGVPLPWWPPDGPNQAAGRKSSGWAASSSAVGREDLRFDDDEDLADEDDGPLTTVGARLPIPPLPDYARHHRRSGDL